MLNKLAQTTISEDELNELLSSEFDTTIEASSTELALFSGAFLFIWLAVVILAIVGMWKVFAKAGQPGWAAIIPIYNIYIMTKIAGREGWWTILYFIPFVNIVVSIIISLDIAKKFGKSELFGIVGLWLFSIIGYLMLGFGDAKYEGADQIQEPAPASQ